MDRDVRAATDIRERPAARAHRGGPRYRCVVALALVMLGPSTAWSAPAQEAGGIRGKRGPLGAALYLAGPRIAVLADVDGDVAVLGGRVSVGQPVRGDVPAARRPVAVAGELRAVGGAVDLAADVAGDVLGAGGTVRVAPETHIRGDAWLVGAEIDVRGRIGRSLHAAGATIRVGAQVQGDVELTGAEIEVLPSARIEGNLTYRSPRPATIHPDARIAGTVTHRRAEAPRWSAWITVAGWLVRIALIASLALAGVVLAAVFPGFTAGAVQTLRTNAWSSLGLGFALWVATPVAAALLLVTVIGIPLGLALAAAYAVALLAGILIAAAFVGALTTGSLQSARRGRMVLSVIIGVVVLGLLTLFPVAGVLAMTIGLVWGLGALAVHAHRLYVRRA